MINMVVGRMILNNQYNLTALLGTTLLFKIILQINWKVLFLDRFGIWFLSMFFT